MLNTSALNNTILPIHAFIYLEITRSQILDAAGLVSDYRLRWVELPQNLFNGTAIGAVVMLPRAPGNTSQEVLMCNLGAGWGASKLNTSTFGGGSQTVNSEIGLNAEEPGGNGEGSQSGPVAEEVAQSEESQFYLPLCLQKPITVTEGWAQYLNPSIAGLNTTLFNHLMASQLLVPDIEVSAKVILAALLANGLVRIGSTSQLQGSVKTHVEPNGSVGLDGNYWFSGKGDAFVVDPVKSKDWVKLRVYSTFEGFAYTTRGTTPKLAICFLLAYCVLALSHVLYEVRV